MAEKLDTPSADLLRSVIDKMTEAPEEPTAEISIEAEIPLALLMKQMDLMAKAV
jgi:hypothetical protein